MEKYFKCELDKDVYKNDIDMQIIEWWAQDEEVDSNESEDESDSGRCKYCNRSLDECKCNFNEYTIRCFGSTKDGVSVSCKITGFKPFYYIKIDESLEGTFNKLKLNYFLKWVESSYMLKSHPKSLVKVNGKFSSGMVEKKDLYGFKNGKKFRFVKLVFNNYTAMMKSRYMFKKPVNIPNVTGNKSIKFKLYESNFEPFMRYCHIKDILMAGWIKLPYGKYKVNKESNNTQLDIEIDRKDITSMREKQDMAKFLQASWDIEVYSFDYSFPDPKYKKNEIFQIATTYQYYGETTPLIKHILTLKHCEKIDNPNVIVEECETEKDLIKRWADLISKMDPDIFYTYNGDNFDCRYLIERAKLFGIQKYVLKKLSRLSETMCVVKTEYFSSSAYGDSEFTRLYIPGRLNYDLLIHYKRGMKKYSSYKLDNIANEILKEGKHDVTAKEIFKYYENGNPKKIKQIAEYCIQDTELLQKLVDKQLILITIIQLANVTFVPIGFLTTRGQTIKVYSQLLRKARQMDFLSPHTNFNENSYAIQIKTKEPHEIDDIAINNDYVEIQLTSDESDKKVNISGKISQIIDENSFVILSDTEIIKEYYNRYYKYKNNKYFLSRMWPIDEAVDDSFTGATVLEPVPGFYGKDNIAVLDFASLYPTIMISRNLCYSTFVLDDKYLNQKEPNYETIAWDDKVAYKLRHTCNGIGKSGLNKGGVCGKQAYFEMTKKEEVSYLENELQNFQLELEKLTQKDEIKKLTTKIKTKTKELTEFKKCLDIDCLDNMFYYCRIHDPFKTSRDDADKFQKKDVSYSYTIVQPHKDEDGNIVNKGVIPALLEELYEERKKVKRQMAQAQKDGNKLLNEILDSTQLAIKVSLNSTYGFFGRCQGNLILKELGSIVTSVGRMLIEESKEYSEGPFLEYIKDNSLLNQQIQSKPELLKDLTKDEKEKLLNYFRVK